MKLLQKLKLWWCGPKRQSAEEYARVLKPLFDTEIERMKRENRGQIDLMKQALKEWDEERPKLNLQPLLDRQERSQELEAAGRRSLVEAARAVRLASGMDKPKEKSE